jgi:hypothetical protein
MAQLPSASAEPPAFQGPLQPHTGREPDLIDNPVGPGEYVSIRIIFFFFNNIAMIN